MRTTRRGTWPLRLGQPVAGRALTALNHVFLALALLISFYPFYYILIYSLSVPLQAIKGVFVLPRGLTLSNYVAVFSLGEIGHAFLISLLRALVGTILTVLSSSLFAFGISKRICPFRKVIYRMLVVSMYFNAGLIPWYITMKSYGLRNNFLLYVLPTAVVAFFVILLKTYFEQLPASLEESAMVDGAGYFRIYREIILPLSKPILATVALFTAVNQWNSWVDNFFLASRPNLLTLQLLLLRYLTEQSANVGAIIANSSGDLRFAVTSSSVKMTITMVTMLPILCVYPFLQRYFAKGLLIGAIKG